MNELTSFTQSFVSLGFDLLLNAPAFVNQQIAIVLIISGCLMASLPLVTEALKAYSSLLSPAIVIIGYLPGLFLTIFILFIFRDVVMVPILVMTSTGRLLEGMLWGNTASKKQFYFLIIPAGITLGFISHFVLSRFAPEYQRFALLLWNIYVAVSSALFLKLVHKHNIIEDKKGLMHTDRIISAEFFGFATIFIGAQFYIPSISWLRITYLALFPAGFVLGVVLTLIDNIFYR